VKEIRYQSRRGWFVVVIGGRIYTWMIEIGRFGISWERRY
jgi:hypothetical protein